MYEKHIWVGKSGKRYTYYIKPIEINFTPYQNGNYIFCKEIDDRWLPLYIGEGDLQKRIDYHKNEDCIQWKDATHIHCHLNSDNQARLEEEEDLLKNHPEAYAPTGCNVKKGG